MKIATIILMCFFIHTSVWAQKERVKNIENFDYKTVHFGFLLGYNSSNFILKPNVSVAKTDTIYAVFPTRKPGFSVGIITDLRLAEHFNLRFIPEVSFINRSINFKLYDKKAKADTFVTKSIESTILSFPLFLKLKSKRVNNYRFYNVAGLRYTIDLASNKDATNQGDDVKIKIQKTDLMYELGFGLDMYLQYFKLAIEARYGFGLRNLYVADNNIYANSFNSLKTRMFLVSLMFE
jgi:hypothetical protein